jgi:hypothetical protein
MSVHLEFDTYDYPINAKSQITARATIGNAQSGGWRMTLEGVEVGKGTKPQIVTLGAGQAVQGKTLQVVITCVDVNPNTNTTVATVAMGGGTGAGKFEQDYDDGGDGDTTIFTFLVDLV